MAPTSMSPVSPTFLPAVSSLKRGDSLSNDVMGKSADGVSVRSTTNSCGVVPLLVTSNVTDPAATVVTLGEIFHSASPTWMAPPAATPDGAADFDAGVEAPAVATGDLAHPVAASNPAMGSSANHLVAILIPGLLLVLPMPSRKVSDVPQDGHAAGSTPPHRRPVPRCRRCVGAARGRRSPRPHRPWTS